MADSNQVRINELARELEIKAKVLIEFLPEVGVAEKKTHSSSIDLKHAELVRKHFRDVAAAEEAAEADKSAKAGGKKPAAKPSVAAPQAPPTLAAKPAAAPGPATTARPAGVPPASAAVPGVARPSAPATATGVRPATHPVSAVPAAAKPGTTPAA
ncbi:MAG: translation initiation factor IF-2 N-terminal domain-containing protein, partial [Candidatus Acidiferrales bacterium]